MEYEFDRWLLNVAPLIICAGHNEMLLLKKKSDNSMDENQCTKHVGNICLLYFWKVAAFSSVGFLSFTLLHFTFNDSFFTLAECPFFVAILPK